MKNGKYNLFTYKELGSEVYEHAETDRVLTVVEVESGVPKSETFYKGEIELIQLLSCDVDSINIKTLPITYQDNGLYGIFGPNKKAKYTKLNPYYNNTFMRYALPNGKEGWLDTSNGRELEDI